MENKKARQSNIELLRIIATMGIVSLHFNILLINNEQINNSNKLVELTFLSEGLFICGVNVFVLISGYFLINRNEIDIFKPIHLLCELIVIQIIGYLAAVISRNASFDTKELLKCFIPVNWYVMVYVGLLMIAPFLNIVITETKNRKKEKRLILILLLTYSVYPFLVDCLSLYTKTIYNGLSTIGIYGSEIGYCIVNFVILYVIGASLKGIDIKIKPRSLIILLSIIALLIGTWGYYEYRTIGSFGGGVAFEYCNPLIITESVIVFTAFLKHTFSSKIINNIARASYMVYLTHGYLLQIINLNFPHKKWA